MILRVSVGLVYAFLLVPMVIVVLVAVLTGLADYLKRQGQQFIAATEDTADGVTITITVGNPPGFAQLRQALRGKVSSLASLRLSDGTPTVSVSIVSGFAP